MPGMSKREVAVFGAAMMGMGSIVGTGIFVGIGVAAAAAGPMSTATSTSPRGSASPPAGCSCAPKRRRQRRPHWDSPGIFLHLLNLDQSLRVPVAVGATALLTVLVLSGLRRFNWMNIAIVSVTLGSLLVFTLFGLLNSGADGAGRLSPLFPSSDRLNGFFHATVLMFVACAGYARIATLGEEVVDPKRNIPLAIVITLIATATLYVAVALAALGAVGAERLAQSTESQATPIGVAAEALAQPWIVLLVSLAAVTAMLSVLLNLILGLSRVVLAMGRQRDLPSVFAKLNPRGDAPSAAVVGVGIAIGALALIGSVETTWAFSALTVLIYYGITNLAALRLPVRDRRYSRWIAIAGLMGCLFLAFWVPLQFRASGLALIAIGSVWHVLARKLRAGP